MQLFHSVLRDFSSEVFACCCNGGLRGACWYRTLCRLANRGLCDARVRRSLSCPVGAFLQAVMRTLKCGYMQRRAHLACCYSASQRIGKLSKRTLHYATAIFGSSITEKRLSDHWNEPTDNRRSLKGQMKLNQAASCSTSPSAVSSAPRRTAPVLSRAMFTVQFSILGTSAERPTVTWETAILTRNFSLSDLYNVLLGLGTFQSSFERAFFHYHFYQRPRLLIVYSQPGGIFQYSW